MCDSFSRNKVGSIRPSIFVDWVSKILQWALSGDDGLNEESKHGLWTASPIFHSSPPSLSALQRLPSSESSASPNRSKLPPGNISHMDLFGQNRDQTRGKEVKAIEHHQ
ncbi:unnamed protein product [Citrullus colocynthis]|uniref:Uncharacterized protein n=1 Tax=Citrullus colocynthis TaxID=252529 RepID=A0ABP0Z702_9ROSI